MPFEPFFPFGFRCNQVSAKQIFHRILTHRLGCFFAVLFTRKQVNDGISISNLLWRSSILPVLGFTVPPSTFTYKQAREMMDNSSLYIETVILMVMRLEQVFSPPNCQFH